MNESLIPLVAAAVLGVGAAFILVFLIRTIPFRIEEQWRLEVEEHMNRFERALQLPDYSLSIYEKVAIFILAPLAAVGAVHLRGPNAEGFFFCVYFLVLILLLGINFKHLLFPDKIVLPAMWIGLLLHAFGGNAEHGARAADHVIGAAFAYAIPWLAITLIKAKTGKEILGHGDLKMFAMAGAWFGVAALPMFGLVFVAVVLAMMVIAAFARYQLLLPTGAAHVLASVAVAAGLHF